MSNFKVGQRVRTRLDSWFSGFTGLDATITEIDEDGGYLDFDGDDEDGKNWPFAWSEIEPIQFKVGDRVQFNDNVQSNWWFKSGQKGTVVATGRGGGLFPYAVRPDDESMDAYVDETMIVPILDEIAAQVPYKVGQQVVVVAENGGGYDFSPKGTVGIVTAVRPDMGLVQVLFDSGEGANPPLGDAGWNFLYDEIAPAPAPALSLAPQTQKVLDLLRSKGSLTGVEAAAVAKVRSLTKRVHELRSAGIPIHSEWRRDSEGQRYVRYYLAEVAAAA